MVRARGWSRALVLAGPFLAAGIAAPRALRIDGVHQMVGLAMGAVLVVALWLNGGRRIVRGLDESRGAAAAGALLQVPFVLVALLWVGLGTPWQATAAENRMRYLVLLAGAIAVTGGFVLLWAALREAGERFASALGLAAGLLAGAGYLVWTSFQVGVHGAAGHDPAWSAALAAMNSVHDVLLFVACALTYAAALAFASALGRAGWLGRGAARIAVAVCLLALVLLFLRGIDFPSATGASSAWYREPGFVVGIPAVPWIVPALLGVALLRRAGDGAREVARASE